MEKVMYATENIMCMRFDTTRRHLFDYVDNSGIVTCEVFRIAKTETFEIREYRGWKMAIKIHAIKEDGNCGQSVAMFRTMIEAVRYLKAKSFEGEYTRIPVEK